MWLLRLRDNDYAMLKSHTFWRPFFEANLSIIKETTINGFSRARSVDLYVLELVYYNIKAK